MSTSRPRDHLTEPGDPADPAVEPVGDRIREAAARGDLDTVERIFGARPVEAWFEVEPGTLRTLLQDVPESVLRRLPALASLRDLLAGVAGTTRRRSGAPGARGGGSREADLAERFVAHIGLRLRGRPRAALKRFSGLGDGERSVTPFLDTTDGFEAFVGVQLGVTRFLAGDFNGAIASFTRVQRNPPERMPYLHREAFVKPALVHALYGDPVNARRKLDRAAALPRSESWIESQIDANAELAEVLLLPPGDEALDRLASLPLPHLGELWPYYVAADWMLHRSVGRRVEGIARVNRFAHVWPVAPNADGFPRSVLALARAENAVLDGDVQLAERHLAEADPGFVLTGAVRAAHDRLVGRRRRAIGALNALAPAAHGLRRFDLQRRILLAKLVAESGDADGARATIRALETDYGALRAEEVALVPAHLADGIRSATPADGPVAAGSRPLGVTPTESLRERLTSRERDVLRSLVGHPTRADAAASLFISLNTFKTHQRSLYRKLGVSTREAAIAEGSRRGLV